MANIKVTNTLNSQNGFANIRSVIECEGEASIIKQFGVIHESDVPTNPTIVGGILNITDSAGTVHKIPYRDIIRKHDAALIDGLENYATSLTGASAAVNKKIIITCDPTDCDCADGVQKVHIYIPELVCGQDAYRKSYTGYNDCTCPTPCDAVLESIYNQMLADTTLVTTHGATLVYSSGTLTIELAKPFSVQVSDLFNTGIVKEFFSGFEFNPDNYLALPSNSASAALVDSTKDYKVLKIGVRQWVKIDNQNSTTSSGNSNPVYGFAPYYAMFLIENDTDANAWLTVLNNKLSGSSLAITEIGALQNSTLETYTTTMQPFCIVKADAGGAAQTAALEATLLAALTTTYGGIQRIDRDSTAGNTRYTVWSTASLGTVTTAAGTIVSCVAGECVTDADDTYL